MTAVSVEMDAGIVLVYNRGGVEKICKYYLVMGSLKRGKEKIEYRG